MTRTHRYIALVLLLILSVAYTYRYGHIAAHQSDQEQDTLCLHQHEDQKLKNQGRPTLDSHSTSATEDETCLICDFEFYVQDLTSPMAINTTVTAITVRFKQLIIRFYHTTVLSHRVPRAPPL